MRLPVPLLLTALILIAVCVQPSHAATLPDPIQDEQRNATSTQARIVLAGGCFWGVEGVFEHVRGVTKAVSGYTGGKADTANYEAVSTGATGHAEAVEVTYDRSQIMAGQLLKIYFSVVADPTTLNYQGPDHGNQYRSAIFVSTPEQQRIAAAYIGQLDSAKSFKAPIVTQISQLEKFYPAEDYHQNYLAQHPYQPYIMIHDAPKVTALKSQFAAMYKE